MTTTTTPTYRVLGTTDENTTCDICGRTELRGTVALQSDDETVYAGSDCASRLTGRPARIIKAEATRGDEIRFRAWAAANFTGRAASNYELCQRRGEWIRAGRPTVAA